MRCVPVSLLHGMILLPVLLSRFQCLQSKLHFHAVESLARGVQLPGVMGARALLNPKCWMKKKRMKETGEGCSKCRWHGTCWRCKRRQIIHMLAAEVGDEIHDDENLGALDGESNEVSDEFPVLEDPYGS